MPNGVFEEPLELEIELLEAGLPTKDSYPYPSLTPSGRREVRSFRSLLLENAYMRVVVVPALGGRIHSIYDKRTGIEILRPAPVTLGSARGAQLEAGIRFSLDGQPRLTDMGSVAFSVEDADEDVPAAVWLAESVNGTGLSWHLRLALAPDAAKLHIEGRVLNRTLKPVAYNPTLLGAEAVAVSGEKWFEGKRFRQVRSLAAHQVDTWALTLTPISLEGATYASADAAIAVRAGALVVQVAQKFSGGKVLILTPGGESLEAKADLYPEKTETFELGGLNPAGVAILDADGNQLLHYQPGLPEEPMDSLWHPSLENDLRSIDQRQLADLTFSTDVRHAVHLLLGIRAGAEDPVLAHHHVEQSLLYNGEDHLAWWLKGALLRHSGAGEAESAELLNAHFLAPLEPVLRAESVLRQGASAASAPNPLVAPMAEIPEELVEVAALLLVSELYEDALVWTDEALRHIDVPILRYLRAFAYLKGGRMEVEAADDIMAARNRAGAPPYAWRTIEKEALAFLNERFPQDEALLEALQLANR